METQQQLIIMGNDYIHVQYIQRHLDLKIWTLWQGFENGSGAWTVRQATMTAAESAKKPGMYNVTNTALDMHWDRSRLIVESVQKLSCKQGAPWLYSAHV